MSINVLAQLAGLRSKPTVELKAMWRELYGVEAPPYIQA
jgi:hypothetical protein